MKKGLIFLVMVLVIFSSAIILAEISNGEIKLNKGENSINFTLNFSQFYVQDLIKAYPEISVITHEENGIEEGYVNVFGGIGKNFLIEKNNIYKVISEKEVNIILK